MFVQNTCTFCGVALPVPNHLVRTGERCPACMVSAENARQSPVGVPAWNAPLPHDIYSVDASTQRQGVRVVRSEWTVRVGVQFPCQYCREHHNETKTLTVTFPVEPAMSEINQWVRNKLGEADWKESEGVLCPKCLHFAPRAVLRHFPHGYREYVLARYRTLRRAELATTSGSVRRSVLSGLAGSVIIFVTALFSYGFIRNGMDGWTVRQAQLSDWLIVAGITVAGVVVFCLGLVRRIRSTRPPALAMTDADVERRVGELDLDASHRLVVRLYEFSAGSLDLKLTPGRLQSLINEM